MEQTKIICPQCKNNDLDRITWSELVPHDYPLSIKNNTVTVRLYDGEASYQASTEQGFHCQNCSHEWPQPEDLELNFE